MFCCEITKNKHLNKTFCFISDVKTFQNNKISSRLNPFLLEHKRKQKKPCRLTIINNENKITDKK